MYDTNENETPVFPFEYDHLLIYSNEDSIIDTKMQDDSVEMEVFNHETYRYF